MTPPEPAMPDDTAPDAVAAPDATVPTPDATTPSAADPVTPVTPPATAVPMQTPAQSMTPAQKAAYDAWPENVRTYFDGLPASRQVLFQRIEDADKVKLAGLPADQQETVWASIEKQDAEQKAKAPATPQSQ